jgi:hypothetical protein
MKKYVHSNEIKNQLPGSINMSSIIFAHKKTPFAKEAIF